MKVGIVIPTYNARHHLIPCLTPLLLSPLKPKILIVDSSSTDATLQLAKTLNIQTIQIKQKKFNHGLTREWARKKIRTDIVVMMTPDAYANSDMLEKLVEPLLAKKASIAFARQLPHDNSSFFASFHRYFLYPEKSYISSQSCFCSDSCAAYLNSALDEIGGFKKVLIGEDTLAAAELLNKGHKIAYVAKAIVKHSHNQTLIQELKRHFDTGAAREMYRHKMPSLSADKKQGKQYALALIKRRPHFIFYTALLLGAKWIGYWLGTRHKRLPHWMIRALTGHHLFWIKERFGNVRSI